jgi:EAL domain-containing protein (putative c-di-GMP-specific phosphodiesterase class I)
LSVPELRFSINLSPRQLVDRSLATRIARVLESRGIPATRCEVEITENALVHFNEDVMRTLRELGELGIQIALDDFGAGYSSLGYLKDLPLNRLKVDRRFIAQLGSDQRSAAIVRAIVAVGHGLGLSVVAEGVEAEAQLEALRTLGCDEVQGYLFGVPAPVAELGR